MKSTSLTIEKQVPMLVENAKNIEINSTSIKEATELLSRLSKAEDQIIEEREKVTKPLNEALKAERARWTPYEAPIRLAIASLRQAITSYQTEAKRIASEQAEAISARIAPGKGNLSLDTALTKINAIDTPDTAIETAHGSIKFRTTQQFEVMDITLVPKEYLLPNEPAIRAAMKSAIEIPGVRYFTEETPVNRR